jgi:hypothetical protein
MPANWVKFLQDRLWWFIGGVLALLTIPAATAP